MLMDNDKVIPKSLVEQITDELIKRLEGKQGFDSDLVKRIKELSINSDLVNHAKIKTILKS